VPNARSAQRKKSAPITMAPPIPTLITHLGSRSGTTPPPPPPGRSPKAHRQWITAWK
jgi:hypothetical protein